MSSADGLEATVESDDEGGDGGGEEEIKMADTAELWDLLRPLIGDCELRLLKFDDKQAQVGICVVCVGCAKNGEVGTVNPPYVRVSQFFSADLEFTLD